MKLLKKTAIILLVAFVTIQFFRPSQNTSHGNHTKLFISETNPPQDVKVLLEQTCYDCHSNNTNYPWYNNVAPVSFWMANHVKDGKKHLNFSEWESYSTKKKDHKLEEVIETLEEGGMPLKEYTWTHERAKLTEEEKKLIVAWAKRSRALYQLKNLQQ
ncbi:heme-binding domain-containing protein [uncultured Maribacter sp.]|uniref:heme-binding domain-containing protein n=1 Tax=uncultured Maribacter sp. TaxID=431308 RepID=UPI002614374D|nr:heme-binding domain-containing protein [uncultured Maribacter sp.]